MFGFGHKSASPLDDDDRHGLGPNVRYGRVAGVDLPAATCTVDIGGDDDPLVSGPIRWIETAAGRTRTWSPPAIGEQVLVLAPEGDLAAAIALRGVRSDEFPAAGDSLRELIAFEDGTIFAYDPESHAAELILCAGGTVTLTADGGVTITGDVTIDGELTVTGDVKAGDDAISLVEHVHGDVQAGSAKTGAPE